MVAACYMTLSSGESVLVCLLISDWVHRRLGWRMRTLRLHCHHLHPRSLGVVACGKVTITQKFSA